MTCYASGATSHTDARSGPLPLIGSLGVSVSTAFRFAEPGPDTG